MSINVRIGEAWVPAARRARAAGQWFPPRPVPEAPVLADIVLTETGFTGSVDQHGTLRIITSDQETRTAQEVKDGTGAEDAFEFFVNAGYFDLELTLENTTPDVQRYMHFGFENDNGLSEVVSIPFTWSPPFNFTVASAGGGVGVEWDREPVDFTANTVPGGVVLEWSE
jgi:hypothetical protein